jgi:hypothetical protein
MSLPPPPKVQKLREALHAKAKTAMWGLAGDAKRECGTYVPYSASLGGLFSCGRMCRFGARDHLCHVRITPRHTGISGE